MKTIHYIVLGAKSPQGRGFIQSLVAAGSEPSGVTAIDVKSGVMSFGENDTLSVQEPGAYKHLAQREKAQLVLAEAKPALVDIADDHLDDGGQVLDLTGHFLNDPEAVLAPAKGKLVVQPSVPARIIDRLMKTLPGKPDTIHLTALLPASHFGKDGMDELYQQVRQFLVAEELDNSVFNKKLAFNVIPYAGDLGDDGLSVEENRLFAELRKLLPGVEEITISTAVVPVFIGVSLQIIVHYFKGGAPSPKEAALAWHRDRSIRVIDPQSELAAASPAEIVGDDMISISRLHTPPGLKHSLSFWAMADNTLV